MTAGGEGVNIMRIRGSLRYSQSMRRQTGQGGAALLGQGLSLLIVVVILAGLIIFGVEQLKSVKANSTAQTMVPIVKIAGQYIDAYSTEITGLLSPGSAPVVIPIGRTSASAAIPVGPSLANGTSLPSFQGAGLLPSDYVDKDAFGQSHDLVVLEPATGQYEALIISVGGREASNTMLGKIAADFPGTGGEIPIAEQGQSASSLGKVLGEGRSWDLSLSSLNIGGTVATPGHYAILLPTVASAGRINLQNYMSRYAPGADAMTTDISMNGNSTKNVGQLSFANGPSVSEPTPGTLNLSSPAAIQGNASVAMNATVSSNLTVSQNLSSSTLDAGSGSITGNATTSTSTVHGSAAFRGGVTGGGNLSTNVAGVKGDLTAQNEATASDAGIFGSLDVSNNLTVQGGNTTASDIVPTGTAVQGAACPYEGAFQFGSYTDITGRARLAEMFCEPSASGDVWQGGLSKGGYAEQTYVQPSCPPGYTGAYTWGGYNWVDHCIPPQPSCPSGYTGSYEWNGSVWVDDCIGPNGANGAGNPTGGAPPPVVTPTNYYLYYVENALGANGEGITNGMSLSVSRATFDQAVSSGGFAISPTSAGHNLANSTAPGGALPPQCTLGGPTGIVCQ